MNNKKGDILKSRIDFVCLVSVKGAMPNGDPNSNGQPRTDSNGHGLISQECIKSKIRKAARFLGENILYQPEADTSDEYTCIKDRLLAYEPVSAVVKDKKNKNLNEAVPAVCENWYDIRLFGCTIPFQGRGSIGITGPVTISNAKTVSPVNVSEIVIVKSANFESKKDAQGDDVAGMSSDRMGTRNVVEFGLYVIKGSISPYQAERTGLTDQDAAVLKDALIHMFDEDVSSARPAGSMNVERLYWWDHNSGERKMPKASAQHIFDSVIIKRKNPNEFPDSMDDYDISHVNYRGVVKPEVYINKAPEKE